MLRIVPPFTADCMDSATAANPAPAVPKVFAGEKECFLRTDAGEGRHYSRAERIRTILTCAKRLNMCKKEDRAFPDAKLTKRMRAHGIDGCKFSDGSTDVQSVRQHERLADEIHDRSAKHRAEHIRQTVRISRIQGHVQGRHFYVFRILPIFYRSILKYNRSVFYRVLPNQSNSSTNAVFARSHK